jgi:hypothetical protein
MKKTANAAAFPSHNEAIYAVAIAVRFLRQPEKPSSALPLAKSGSAAGSGVSAVTRKLSKDCAPLLNTSWS